MNIDKISFLSWVYAFTFAVGLTAGVSGCKAAPLTDAKGKPIDASAKTRFELIKEEKRKQSEADLPFRGIDPSQKISVIAFGSSADQAQPQPIWSTIAKQNPDLFVFTGDHLSISKAEQRVISEQYKKLNRISDYRDIREKVPFMAVYDDNEDIANENNLANIDKDTSKTEFVRYWSYLKTTLGKQQKALYHSKMIGVKKNTVQIIMLDTRSDRSELKKNTETPKQIENVTTTVTSTDQTTATTTTLSETRTLTVTENRPFLADDDKKKHFLSEEQWSWLESELRKQAGLKILVSPIQVIANDHGFEKWGNFPQERERLLNLIKYTKARNVLILSGNRQAGSIAQIDLKGLGKVYDVTSGPISGASSPGQILKDASYTKEAFPEVNFGLIKIDWNSRKALVELHSLDNKVVNSTEVKF